MSGYQVPLPPLPHRTLRYWSCGHHRSRDVGSPLIPCPACGEQLRRNRNHWSALIAAIVIALLVVCAVAGGGY